MKATEMELRIMEQRALDILMMILTGEFPQEEIENVMAAENLRRLRGKSTPSNRTPFKVSTGDTTRDVTRQVLLRELEDVTHPTQVIALEEFKRPTPSAYSITAIDVRDEVHKAYELAARLAVHENEGWMETGGLRVVMMEALRAGLSIQLTHKACMRFGNITSASKASPEEFPRVRARVIAEAMAERQGYLN